MHSIQHNRYIPPSFEARVENEEVTAYELERLFTPDRFELLDIQNNAVKGYAGFIFSLEGALVNLEMAYIVAFNELAKQLGVADPSVASILEVIGLNFRDAIAHLNFPSLDLDHIEMKSLEMQFYENIDNYIAGMDLQPYPGAAELLDASISDQNAISIVTTLPRSIAQHIFAKSQLATLLEGRIDSRNLISLSSVDDMKEDLQRFQDDLCDLEHSINRLSHRKDLINAFHPTYGDRYYQNHLLKACGRLYKAPMSVVYFDRNHKIIHCAKKSGMSTVSIRSPLSETFSTRGADAVVDDLASMTLKNVYQIVRRAIQHAQGPAQQPISTFQTPKTPKLKEIETPFLEPEQGKEKETASDTNNFEDALFNGNSPPPSTLSLGMDEDDEDAFRWLDSSPRFEYHEEDLM